MRFYLFQSRSYKPIPLYLKNREPNRRFVFRNKNYLITDSKFKNILLVIRDNSPYGFIGNKINLSKIEYLDYSDLRPGYNIEKLKTSTKIISDKNIAIKHANDKFFNVFIPEGGTYYLDDEGMIIIGWHGSVDPPRRM